MFIKLVPILLVVIALIFLSKWAIKAWRKADVEEKIEEKETLIEAHEEIKEFGSANEKKAEKAQEKIDDFLNS